MAILQEVKDPEIPVISIIELGIVRGVATDGESVTVTITPTYSGCPAMDFISQLIREALDSHGMQSVAVQSTLSPPWTTDWITEEGMQKLRAFGIAPPAEKTGDTSFLQGKGVIVECPRCQSGHTRLVSQFGSTPCKALYQCQDCLEPFDYFKCH